MIISGSGHRPTKLGGYSAEAFMKLVVIAREWLNKNTPETVISGMAIGWDQALAQASIDVGIPFIAAVPFSGQASVWPPKARTYYNELMKNASKTIIISTGTYSVQKMHVRNEWMVDQCNTLLVMYDTTSTSGGTRKCIKYAEKRGKPVINLYDKWIHLITHI